MIQHAYRHIDTLGDDDTQIGNWYKYTTYTYTRHKYHRFTCSSSWLIRCEKCTSQVVDDRQILAAHQTVLLEPFDLEHGGGRIRRVAPFHSDAIVLDVFVVRLERCAGDDHVHGVAGAQRATWRVQEDASRLGRLEGESNALASGVDQLKLN